MLQISTGRFFSGDGELHERQMHAILFANTGWISDIETCVGTLSPEGFGTGG